MIDFHKSLALQNYTLRHFKAIGIPEFCAKLRETKINRIELRSPETAADCDAQFAQFTAQGVEIAHTFYPCMVPDEARARIAFDFAKRLGHHTMTVNYPLDNNIFDALKLSEKLAEEYDITLGIHNHGGGHWLGSREVLDFIFKNTSERIGLCLDTAHAVNGCMNPVEAVRRYAKRLIALHLKDDVYRPDGSRYDVVLGTGNLKLPELMAALREIDFNGIPIIEYEGEPENPVSAILAAREAILALA